MEKAKERITRKITIDHFTGCWIWNGNPRENGYCRTTFDKESWYITRKENMQDCVKKGRQAKSFKLPQCKLSEEQKKEIVQRALEGEFYKKIAKDFGITRTHAGYIAINFGNVRRNNVVSK